jgi:hypothetical protein
MPCRKHPSALLSGDLLSNPPRASDLPSVRRPRHSDPVRNLSDDADTVGAVTGQLAVTVYGLSGIPARWAPRLAWRPRLPTMADALVERGGR